MPSTKTNTSPKERILETASILFHQQGFNSTGINQVIAEAKVAKASFYQHYKSKDELCVAYLNARHDYWFSAFQAYLSKSKGAKNRVVAAFDFLIHMNEKENFRGCAFLNILSEIAKEQEAILAVIQSHKRDLSTHFEKELGDELLSAHIYLLFESAIVESQLFKSNAAILKLKKIINTLI